MRWERPRVQVVVLLCLSLVFTGCTIRAHNWIFNRFEGCNPRFSPDGSEILFSSLKSGCGDIYVVDADGANPRRLTSSRAWEGYAEWSPDGQTVAFVREGHDGVAIWAMDRGGGHQRRLGSEGEWIHNLVCSPDGSRVAYGRSWWVTEEGELPIFRDVDSGPSRTQIWVAHIDGTGESLIWEGSSFPEPVRFSPDGLTLEVCDTEPSPSSVLPPEDGPELAPANVSPEALAREAPDGRSTLDSTWDYGPHRRGELLLRPADGSISQVLASGPGIISDYRFSPDGARVLYFIETGNVGLGDLHVVNVDGSGDHVVGMSRRRGVVHALGRVVALVVSIPATFIALVLYGV